MAIPKLIRTRECFATPYFFWDVSELNRVDLGRLNDATKPLSQIVDFNDIARLITALAIFTVRFDDTLGLRLRC